MKVSVLMATYNGAAYLHEQLRSILEGVRPPDELIIVDDGSSDGTAALVQHVCEGYPSMTLVIRMNASNLGASPTFGRAVMESSGDIVLFADQDDVWSPGKIKAFVNLFMERPEILMAYSDGDIVDTASQPTGRTIFTTRNKAHLGQGGGRSPEEVAANPDIKGCTMALNGPFARRLFTEIDPAALAHWGHDHWAALFAYGLGPVAVIAEPLIKHRIHGGNASAGMRFNPLNSAHRQRYLRKAREQGRSYFVDRYKIAIEHALKMGTEFSPPLLGALETMLAISERRRDLHSLPFLRRIAGAWRLLRKGVYHRYYNGIFTLLRDILV